MSSLLISFLSVSGFLSSISLDPVLSCVQELFLWLLMLSLFTEVRQRHGVQKAAGVQTFSCSLIPEDVPLCGPSHKFQSLDPFSIWTINCVDNLMSSLLSGMSEVSSPMVKSLLSENCLGLQEPSLERPQSHNQPVVESNKVHLITY